MDDEVGDNDEEMSALLDDLDEAFAWTDSFCADAISSDFVKEAPPCGLICESSEITSATTSGKVADFIPEEQRKWVCAPLSSSFWNLGYLVRVTGI
jgi:hypothetical protein